MKPTVQTLLDRADLALGLLTPADALAPGALETPVVWAHTSDLPDPTPFLDAGHVLLTTGTQFGDASGGADAPAATSDDDAFADAYVRRLREAGVAALGFGTEVIRAGTPDALVAACTAQGLPLFEVPYRVPFIAIARLVADLLAEDAYARQAWALAAQRAISLAALRPDGLSATLTELSHRLGTWVGLIDATGSLDREAPLGGLGQPALGEVVGEARSMLRRGQRASRTLLAAESTGTPQHLTLQTLGGGGGAARRARDRRLPRARPGRAARSSPRSSRSRGSRSSRTATSTGRAGTCARACCAASSPATPHSPSGWPPRCGASCRMRRCA